MGAWGPALYSGDFAADLRSTIGAVMRLPFDTDRLVETLCETEATTANDPNDPEHTVFWLVLADQFSKRNMASDRIREMALSIIDSERDIEIHESLGMTSADLAKRRKTLAELRAQLVNTGAAEKPRKTLKDPQPLLMQIGDLFVYPTCQGQAINPYFKESDWPDYSGWKPDSWGAALIIDVGRAFDYLAWYRPLTLVDSLEQKPNLDFLSSQLEWVQRNPGTCTASHLKRLQFEKLSNVAIDETRLRQSFPNLAPGIDEAVQDISIGNQLGIGPFEKSFYYMGIRPDGEVFTDQYPTIGRLATIMAEDHSG